MNFLRQFISILLFKAVGDILFISGLAVLSDTLLPFNFISNVLIITLLVLFFGWGYFEYRRVVLPLAFDAADTFIEHVFKHYIQEK